MFHHPVAFSIPVRLAQLERRVILDCGLFPCTCSQQTAMGMRKPCCNVAIRKLCQELVTREAPWQCASLQKVNLQGRFITCFLCVCYLKSTVTDQMLNLRSGSCGEQIIGACSTFTCCADYFLPVENDLSFLNPKYSVGTLLKSLQSSSCL